jgi:hypothetical protein
MRKDALAAAGSLLVIVAALFPPQVIDRASAATAKAAGKKVTFATNTFRIARPNDTERLVVLCPGKKVPLGGGMTSSPPPGPGSEGIYPHSYERLGEQAGWHSTVLLFDPTPGTTTPRNVTLQVVCGKKLRPGGSRHDILNLSPGQTKTAVAKCPSGRRLFGGGFQRMYFDHRGGVFVTESRAISAKAWSVTGRSFGIFGAQMVAIAYCVKGKKPRLTEVSASTTIATGAFGTATTPECPPRRRLTMGGFSTSPTGSTLMTNGIINPDGTWSTSGYNNFGPAARLTAFGYCLRPR